MTILWNVIENDLLVWLPLTIGVLWLAKKLERRKYWVAGGIAGAVIMLLCFFMVRSDRILLEKGILHSLQYIVVYILTVLIVFMTYKCHLIAAVFYATEAYCLQNGAAQIWGILSDEQIIGKVENSILRTIILIISFVFIDRYLNTTSTAENYMEKNKSGKRMVLAASVLILFTTVVLQIMSYGDLGNMESVLGYAPRYTCWYLHITSAIISYLVLMLTLSDVSKSDEKKKMEMALGLLEKDKMEYEQEKAVMDALNIKCHDLRHKIEFLEEKGYRRELQDINELIDVYDSPNRTGNRTLDIVIAEKTRACLGKKISMTCMADGALLSFMEQSDIYSLFGNLLDNAINAVSKINEPEKKIIILRVRKQNAFVLIEAENYYLGEIEFAYGLPKTETKDYVNHGFGMQSMKIIAEKYGGNLAVDASDGVFRLSVMMAGEYCNG